ncbi:MAG: peroxiredoxin [Limnobacter sp.]|nr:peroxiredoxin [Limnobacter sp.]
MSVEVGQEIPDFKAIATQGEITPASLKGKNVVLYFYPKDNTPGCTTQGENFRDLYPDFQKHDCEVIGVSRDSIKSHENFINKKEFPFDLISDSDETLCNLFDVIKMKNMYGKQVRGIERSTFVFNKKGELVKEWRKVRVPGHVDAVLDFVRSLDT